MNADEIKNLLTVVIELRVADDKAQVLAKSRFAATATGIAENSLLKEDPAVTKQPMYSVKVIGNVVRVAPSGTGAMRYWLPRSNVFKKQP